MTGSTDRIIHSGRLPERRNASIRRSRLMAFLRRWPDVVRTSLCSVRASVLEVDPLMISRTASAPMPALEHAAAGTPGRTCVELAVARSRRASASAGATRSRRAACAISSLRPCGVLLGARLALGLERLVDRGSRSSIFCSTRECLLGLALLELRLDLLDLSPTTLFRRGERRPCRALSPAATMTSPVGSKTIVSAALAGLQLGERPRLLRRGRDLLGARWRAPPRVRLDLGECAVQLVRLRVELGAELVLELGERLPASPPRPSASSSSCWTARLRGVLVDPGDDVQGEVEDALQVARADVEQDAEAARRALEVPDVADRAGQLDVAHPLAAHLGAGDLDAALVADDALVADALVLAAVALPVLGGTEDALVEEAVLLRLEGAVVDRLRLGDLALRPVPDLLRATRGRCGWR